MVLVRALGTAQIDAGELRITPSSVRKFALLLRLADEAGRLVPRTVLRELVFPDLPERNARHSLRELAYQFRQAGVQMRTSNDGIALVTADIASDYAELMASAEPSIEQLRAAQGGLLPGYAPEHSEAFTDWLSAYRARTTLNLCRALAKIFSRSKSVGNWLVTEHAARACLELDPTHEEATLALAETLAVSGSKAKAIDLLDNYVRELGPARRHLQVPATVVRRRISERLREPYRGELTLPFLGRDAEMLLLHERYELALKGESQCAVIVGDAGIGKTRLAEEFCTQAVLRGARVEHVATQPHDSHRPMATFADLVPRLLRLPGAIGCSPESMAALKRLTTHDGDGSTSPDGDAPSEAVAAAIARAIADLVDAITNETPLALLVDDIQWSDELSRLTIAALASTKQRRRLIVVLTSRDRKVSQFFAQRAERVAVLALPPLQASALQRILAHGSEGSVPIVADMDLRAWIADSSGGNPFFLRCLISHLLSTGERFVVPNTLNALLDQQLAALSTEALSVLSMCVVLGRHAETQRLITALEIPHIQLQIALRELESAHLVALLSGRIEAAHWLVAEAVDRSMSPILRRLLHRRVASLLEVEARETRAAAHFWDCAEHWILAAEPARASAVLRTCADHSLEIGRSREAAEVLLRAAMLVEGKEQLEIASRAIDIADVATESDVVIRGADFIKTLDSRVAATPRIALAEATARLSTNDSWDGCETIKPWLGKEHPLKSRIRAAMTLMVVADFNCDPLLAKEVYSALESDLALEQVGTDVERMKLLLIFHSRFGDIDVSVRVAHRLLALGESLEGFLASDLQRKSAVAILRAGSLELADATLRIAYENARAAGLLRQQCVIAGMLVGTCSDLGLDQEVTTWLGTIDEMADLITDYRTSLVNVSVNAEIECTRGNAERARQWIDLGRPHIAASPTVRGKRWMRMLELWVELLEDRAHDPATVVTEMTRYHQLGSEPGDLSDTETAVAMLALTKNERIDQARDLLHRYVQDYRRVRGPLARALQQMAHNVGWQGDRVFVPALFASGQRSNLRTS